MEHSTRSSKVTVEYTDPSGIYPVISGDLRRHLPLRNLYWNSTSRPLRSIAFLHIDLIKLGTQDAAPASVEKSESIAQNGAAEPLDRGANSQGAGQRGSGVGAKKERRHQIPGLRQTPYLKLFFLRCSDVESYRATYRVQIRDWVKDNTPPTQSTAALNAQEFHDAFEWLIVHVVLPDDGRSLSHPSNTSKSDVRNGQRGSDAVVDKVRADFNGTSKTAVDRVAQVRIRRNSENISISGQDQDPSAGWAEFILKAKSLILSSFDLRVTQYEEDIKERDAQRNVPGWNFNTFFVLKEGLARGFESVGLVEDALSGYQELAAGLTSAIEANDSNGQQRDHFKDHTDDISAELKRALQSDQVQSMDETNDLPAGPMNREGRGAIDRVVLGANILDTDRKPFRELILANEISVFDFRCYLFAREVALLLRLANVSEPAANGYGISSADMRAESVEVATKASRADVQNLLILAEVCLRALDFFAFAGRLMRDDLRSSIDPLSKIHATARHSMSTSFEGPIGDLIASWTYSACQCILDATDVPSLAVQLQTLLRTIKPTWEAASEANSPAIALAREELPRRTSSLPVRAISSPKLSMPDRAPAITSLEAMRLLPTTPLQSGTQALAAQQAELVALKRRIVASVGSRSSHVKADCAESASAFVSTAHGLEDVPLGNAFSVADEREGGDGAPNGNRVSCVQNEELRKSLLSENAYSEAYENLTALALALNVVAERRRSAESLTADLAAMRYRSKDYSSAASDFHQLSSFYHNNDWALLELPMLDMYARSLRNLDRKQDFICAGLQILAKSTHRSRPSITLAKQNSLQESRDLGHYLEEIINASKSLERTLSAPLSSYFSEVSLDPHIQHFEERDGFYTTLKLQNLMPEAFEAHEVRVKLVGVNVEQRCNIWLSTGGPELVRQGSNQVIVQTTMTCMGWYRLERIELRSANLCFVYDEAVPTGKAFFDASTIIDDMNAIIEAHSAPIFVWCGERALEARVSLCKYIHLGQPRLLEVSISSGRNDISHGRMNIRACSAGLRLHTAEAEVICGNVLINDKSQAGSLGFDELNADAQFSVRIPYRLENDLTEIKVKAEVSYTVAGKEYLYICNGDLSIQLQLSVNVQDSFQERALISNFKIGIANSVPSRISNYSMPSTKAYQVTLPPMADDALEILARQPLSLIAKIQRKALKTEETLVRSASDRLLMLRIRYACLDQEVNTAVEDVLSAALHESKFSDLSGLLVGAFCEMLQSQLSTQDLESIVTLSQIRILPFEYYDWDSVLVGLHPEKRAKIQPWLTEWHTNHATIELPQEIDARNLLDLIVPVELPQIPVVVTARLDLVSCMAGPGEAHCAALDQSILAEATFRYSCYWVNDGSDTVSEGGGFDITYEFQAHQDVWLIGGQRRVHYSAKTGENRRFPIILLPQKTGHLQYPSLEVHITQVQDDRRPSNNLKGGPKGLVACEVDYLNQGESILIISNLSSSTVSLDSDSPSDGAWLFESMSRME